MTRASLLALLLATATAHADIASGPPASRAALPSPSWAETGDVLPVSAFSDVTIAGHTVDLYCPHVAGPGPLLVIAPDRGEPRRELAPVARRYASLGYVTVVADAGALAAVARATPQRDDEPGCRTTGEVGVLGFGAGGRAALAVHGVTAAVSLYAGFDAAPAHVAPSLIVEIDAQTVEASPTSWVYSEPGTLACDFRPIDAECWADRRDEWDAARRTAELDRAAKRRAGVLADTIPFLRVWLDRDGRAGHFLDSRRLYAGPPMGLVAEPPGSLPGSPNALFSLSLVGGFASSGDATVGGRAELIYRRHRERIRRGLGIGGYGELAALSGGSGIAGAGVTVVGYSGHGTALAPSFGVETGPHGEAVAAGLFLGYRGYVTRTSWDLPVGVRVDGSYGLDGHDRLVRVSVVADLRGLARAFASAVWLATYRPN